VLNRVTGLFITSETISQESVFDCVKGLSLYHSILELVTTEDIITLISASQQTKWAENNYLRGRSCETLPSVLPNNSRKSLKCFQNAG